ARLHYYPEFGEGSDFPGSHPDTCLTVGRAIRISDNNTAQHLFRDNSKVERRKIYFHLLLSIQYVKFLLKSITVDLLKLAIIGEFCCQYPVSSIQFKMTRIGLIS